MTQWRDGRSELRAELAQVRAQRQQQAATLDAELQIARQELARLADSLDISELLAEINSSLLEGQGEIETIVSWDSNQVGPEEDELEDELEDEVEALEDEDDVIAKILSWEESGEREIAVELVLSEQGSTIQVNGVEIRPERGALEQALLEAFRDELDL